MGASSGDFGCPKRHSDSYGYRHIAATSGLRDVAPYPTTSSTECNMTAPSKASGSPPTHVPAVSARRGRTYPVSDGEPVEVTEDGSSIAGRLAWLGARLTIWPALAIGSHRSSLPWPFGLVDSAARALLPIPGGTIRTSIALPCCTAQLVRAKGVLPADGTRRIVLYLHGGAFLTCGAHSHGRLTTMISKYADAPLLVPNYRLMPKHSVGQALEDCYDGYRWLRARSYQPDQIVLAGDSAGGYLALALAERLLDEGEEPAALVALSPLLQLDKEPKKAHPNIRTDAMFSAKAFDALADLITNAAARHVVDGRQEDIYEPLDHIEPGLPRTLIHVSGNEVLLYDARLAARRLAAAGVPTEVRIWPGQVHVFQICAAVPEATLSLRQIGEYIQQASG
jgi:acetyl esterase/lipase